MKKFVFFTVLILAGVLLANCAPPSLSFEEKVATQVAISLTATALDEILKIPTETPTPTPTDTHLPTPTQEMPEGDPKSTLGSPAWRDDLSTGRNWGLEAIDRTIGCTIFSVQNGKLVLSSQESGCGYNWWLNLRELKNAYLEAKFEVDSCSGADAYGLMFRVENIDDPYAYYYQITCNGRYDLRRWTPSGSVWLLGSPKSDLINAGSNQTNILGVWMENDRIRLYVNGHLLQEITDKELTDAGMFGVFINAAQTPNLTVRMDEIAYWLLD